MIPLAIDLLSLPARYIVLFGTHSIVVAMGLFIVYQAYQGYRRNANRRMVFLGIGLALITVATPLISIVVAAIGFGPMVYQYHLPLTASLFQLLGLTCIIYSLSISNDS